MGARTYWVAPLPPVNFADGTANATTSLADISPAPQKTIPGLLLELGTHIRLSAWGEYTCGTTATNLTIGFYYGGAAGTLLAGLSGQALTVSTTSVPWWMQYEGEVRALSATAGTIKGMGSLRLATSLTAWTDLPFPATAAARTVSTLDTTTNKIITAAASVSQTTGAPTVTCYSLSVELLG